MNGHLLALDHGAHGPNREAQILRRPRYIEPRNWIDDLCEKDLRHDNPLGVNCLVRASRRAAPRLSSSVPGAGHPFCPSSNRGPARRVRTPAT